MAVELERLDPVGVFPTTRWRVTATPDSGKAFWSVVVLEKQNLKNPLAFVSAALSRAARIDRQFSNEQIERRRLAKIKKAKRQELKP